MNEPVQITSRGAVQASGPIVAVTHGLERGGAHRRLHEQVRHLGLVVEEFCPSSATAVTDHPIVSFLPLIAERVPMALRPPLRYIDLALTERAWSHVSRAIVRASPAVVFANPCRLVQTPPLRIPPTIPVVYFCDEPRRVDYEPAVAETRRRSTRTLYGPLHRAERRLDVRGVHRADVLLTNSRYTAGRIEQAYGRVARPVPLGVSAGILAARDAAVRADRPPYVLSVGALLPAKGHDLAIRAAAVAATPIGVVVVTPRRDDIAAATLARLAGSLGVALDVHVGISDHELSVLYQGAVALLYLGLAEPFGLASIEAQACGCPAIVANEGGLPETVIDGVTGRVVPRTANAAAAAIDEIVAHRERFAAEARRRGEALTWEASAAVIRSIIDDLVAAG